MTCAPPTRRCARSPSICWVAGFHAQQCAEKYLKAVLVRHEADVPFTHDLRVLLDLTAEWLPATEDLADVVRLNVYAVALRYPGVTETVPRAEAEAAIELAARVRHAVHGHLSHQGVVLPTLRP